ncbi:MAG: TnsA endonuclease C-terminal domain-containing protein, partial [Desulfitobacteriaceae bacterium]|nr:TnsA endonuclease C-terminal domain-containing protein [Desulfitobacteriaceae bacterium]
GTLEEAIAVKSSGELASKRVLEKLELERRYWEKRNTSWHIVTEREIPATVVENLEWIRPYHSLQALSPLTGEDVDRIRFTLERYLSGTEVLSTVTRRVDDRLGFGPGTSLSVTRYLLASRLWRADISLPMGPEQPLSLLGGLRLSSGVVAS